MSRKQLTIGHFAAHCLDELKAVQEGDTVIEILNSGKVVAVLSPPAPEEPAGTLADWIGSGAGSMRYAPGYDPDEPAFEAQDFWSDSSADQCAAHQRVPIVRRPDEFFGEGTPDEWEGFDEALRQWRSEKMPAAEEPHAA